MSENLITSSPLITTSFFFDNSKDAIFIIDDDKIIEANQSGIKLLCLEVDEELDSPNIFKIIKDGKGQEYTFDEFIARVNGNTAEKLEFLFITSRSFFWAELTNTRYTADNRSFLFSVWRDITKYKQSEAKLAKKEKQLKEAQRISQLAFWEVDVQTRDILLNKKLADLLELNYSNSNKRIGLDEFINSFVLKEDRNHIERAFQVALKTQEDTYQDEFEFGVKRKSNHVSRFKLSIKLGKNREGKSYPYGTIQDVTGLSDITSDIELFKLKLEKRFEQKELALQRSKEKLHDALKLTNTATWESDINSPEITFGASIDEILGIEGKSKKGLEKIILKDDFRKYVHPEDITIYDESYSKALKSKSRRYVDHVEYRIVRPDESIRTLYVTTKIMLDEKGNQLKHYGTIQDITEIQIIENELSKSKEQLSDALSIANLYTWELDMKSEKFKMGDNFSKMVGDDFPIQDGNIVDVQDYISIIYPDDLHAYYIALDRAMKSKEKEYIDFVEYRIQRDDGEIRNIYVSIKVQKDDFGNHIKHYGTIQDITDIRKAVAEKERFSAIIEATSDIVVILDKNLNLIYINQAARDFYGFSPEDDVQGFPIKILQSEHSAKLTREVAIPAAAENGIWNGENIIQRYDKELITVSQVILSHKTPDGEVEYYSSIIRDISNQKKIEQDLKYKNNELDTFVYKASHDLRGPVTSLLGLYNVVKNEVKDTDALKYFDLYNRQIDRLNNIIITLIQLTRIKEVDVGSEPIDFKEIIDSCINSFTNLPNFEFVSFGLNIDLENDFVSDKGLITTILQNLIENAIKYSKPRTKCEVNVEIKYHETEQLWIKVEDEGIGIPQEVQSEVFNMFFRANDFGVGSGLGLYILKNAVEKLGGKISLTSEVNMGTTFVIKLPQRSQ
ncbi:PAS domain S-box protein [Fulvivirgaceae bacterium BMA10]|uniref:histidine kinase n=1 Tax=Splendidivirga corallicola TaxID=3051826 RepID=A0ABT8KQP4_9BACT|nr:PAS domain S-box protein [Fulvivirgaceae bacterium BMA10]